MYEELDRLVAGKGGGVKLDLYVTKWSSPGNFYGRSSDVKYLGNPVRGKSVRLGCVS